MAALIKALLQPVAIVWLGLLALCVWQIYKRHYRWAAVPGALFLFVFITGSSPLAGYLLAGLEAPYARTNWDDLPKADAVVVLGAPTYAQLVGRRVPNCPLLQINRTQSKQWQAITYRC